MELFKNTMVRAKLVASSSRPTGLVVGMGYYLDPYLTPGQNRKMAVIYGQFGNGLVLHGLYSQAQSNTQRTS
jgi:hypothetical protein